MRARILFRLGLIVAVTATAACNGSNASSQSVPQASFASVRYVEGAPELDGKINGAQAEICGQQSLSCYLQVNGNTVSNQLYYGYMTPFMNVKAGTASLIAADSSGYTVGPIKSDSLSAGKRYTIVIVGVYPNYKAVAFEEPGSSSDAQLSLYEASPSTPKTEFGSFQPSNHSNFKQLGSASFGQIQTVSVGKSVADFGGYAGTVKSRIGMVTPAQVDDFDTKNVLPFQSANRLSLFLFDGTGSGKTSQLFGSLDQ